MPQKRLIRSTTVLCVRRDGHVVMAGDGQVTLGASVMKHNARKIRRLYNDKILAGFAGSTADAFSLFARFEAKLEQYHGNLGRGAVELAKEWRTDKMLRHLEALLLVADTSMMFLISGAGDVIEPVAGAADCRGSHEDRRQDLYFYQREFCSGRAFRGAGNRALEPWQAIQEHRWSRRSASSRD